MRPWPVTLRARTPGGLELLLRPLHRRDRDEWVALRRRNREWLAPWDATPPDGDPTSVSYAAMLRQYGREARAMRMLPFVIEVEDRLVGAMHLYGVTWGSMRSSNAGYWIDESQAGRRIAPTALAMVCDYALGGLELHRVEVNIRPENANSLAVVARLGMREEGLRKAFLHIGGQWCDHRSFALTTEDLGGRSVLSRLGGQTVPPDPS